MDGGKIGQGLHRYQGDGHHDGRARQRQAEAAKTLPGGAAQQTAGVNEADRLLQKGGAGQQINVGKQHQRQHPGGAAEGADGRKPVIGGGLPVKQGA